MYLDASAVTSHGLLSWACDVVKTWDGLRGGQRRDRIDRVVVGDIVLDGERAVAEFVGGQRSMTAMFASS
jgi:hypothetical protein